MLTVSCQEAHTFPLIACDQCLLGFPTKRVNLFFFFLNHALISHLGLLPCEGFLLTLSLFACSRPICSSCCDLKPCHSETMCLALALLDFPFKEPHIYPMATRLLFFPHWTKGRFLSFPFLKWNSECCVYYNLKYEVYTFSVIFCILCILFKHIFMQKIYGNSWVVLSNYIHWCSHHYNQDRIFPSL